MTSNDIADVHDPAPPVVVIDRRQELKPNSVADDEDPKPTQVDDKGLREAIEAIKSRSTSGVGRNRDHLF
jgi:hypothetical protein